MVTKRAPKKAAAKPSRGALAVAEAMLAPLRDLLTAQVRQNEMNSELLLKLDARVEKLAGQLDRLQQVAPAEKPEKLLTEPAPVPGNGLLTEEFKHEPKGNIP